MKNLFYFIISICTLYACSSDSDFNPEDENPTSSDFYELKAIPDKKVIFKAYPANMKQILGAGYDVTADHLSPEAIKAPIIDLEKLENSDEDYIYRMKATSSEPRDYAGENATTFLTDITNSLILGDINSEMLYRSVPFSSIKSSSLITTILHNILFASSEQLFTAERWYFSFFYTLEKYKYRYLTQEFENDVTSLAAEDIINKYGTHLFSGCRYRSTIQRTLPDSSTYSDISYQHHKNHLTQRFGKNRPARSLYRKRCRRMGRRCGTKHRRSAYTGILWRKYKFIDFTTDNRWL